MILVPLATLFVTLSPLWVTPNTDTDGWHQWRGPSGNGVASKDASPPIEWSEQKNIKWKSAIPGKGLASPIIIGDMIILLTAVADENSAPQEKAEEEPPQEESGRGGRRGGRGGRQRGGPLLSQEFFVMALDRNDGEVLWKTKVNAARPHEGTHSDGTYASASAVTDGEMIYASFGSYGLFALDLEGEVAWNKDLGDMKTRNSFGEGATPSIYEDTIVLPWDHEGDSFVVAMNKNTGEEKWRSARDERTNWATPYIVDVEGRTQVIVNGTVARSYDLETGKEIWNVGGNTQNVVPSPVYSDGVVFLMSGFRGACVQAIDLAEAKGDLTGSAAILWSFDRDTPYVPSPCLYEDTLYFVKTNSGLLTAFNTTTGTPTYGPVRLGDVQNVYASPVAANGYVYFAGRDGATAVVKHGDDFELSMTNTLDDGFDASPAIIGNCIYLRGKKNLYCISE